jgi:hypothetical protein
LGCALADVLSAAASARAQTPIGTNFSYQGRLNDGGVAANGSYDLRLRLFDAQAAGAEVGLSPITLEDVDVAAGLFTVQLDFGPAAFAGSKRWLEVSVRPGASTGAFVTLSPRQEIASAPNSVFSQTVPWAGVSGKPGGFADGVDNDVLGLAVFSGQPTGSVHFILDVNGYFE